jgi:carbon-monoxide dehydrogenase iron sulfur subunit
MKRVYVDEKWCIGCRLCEYWCSFASTNEKDMVKALKGREPIAVLTIEQLGKLSFSVSCRHCVEPLCVKGCITGALQRVDGVIKVDRDRCVGCYTCIASCPYGAIFPTEMGVVDKCELCTNNIHKVPQCVYACPNRALVFEDRG